MKETITAEKCKEGKDEAVQKTGLIEFFPAL